MKSNLLQHAASYISNAAKLHITILFLLKEFLSHAMGLIFWQNTS